MKKIFISSLIALFATLSFGQKIDYDKTEANGLRIISTEQAACRNMKDRIVLSTGLSVITDQKESTTYRLDIKLSTMAKPDEHFAIEQGAKILVRTGDESVLQFECKERQEDLLGTITNVGGMVYNNKTLFYSIDLSSEELAHLCSGILKFRCEITAPNLNASYFETEFKKPKNADHFAKSARLLKNTLDTKTSGDITDGF